MSGITACSLARWREPQVRGHIVRSRVDLKPSIERLQIDRANALKILFQKFANQPAADKPASARNDDQLVRIHFRHDYHVARIGISLSRREFWSWRCSHHGIAEINKIDHAFKVGSR